MCSFSDAVRPQSRTEEEHHPSLSSDERQPSRALQLSEMRPPARRNDGRTDLDRRLLVLATTCCRHRALVEASRAISLEAR
eukprot:7390768-Prymnesium_polylepis.1